ncbi:hypothetical protein HF329_10725 [Chitinophaga oryzae]|uniref:DUF6850 domain-containing protein n=1 Tax=Chitinophaga oryzae TaxID=2725414 RepID=A0AAE6ZFI8_9BACT|nr:DUF6850 family outer membrane beta-barrel protein [Chitinophaga oryzae]QJB31766.1 hypothetical protein HF329_10725 [Chitinophaga oryzae]
MKKFYLLITCQLLSAGVIAQSDGASDSLLTYRATALQFRQAAQGVTLLQHYASGNVGIVSLQGTAASGGYRLAQEPQQHRVASFGSEGIKEAGRFKLYGQFTYSRTWDDSLAWMLSGIAADNRPYYFAAGKAGKYDRQSYQMKGLAAYTLRPDKWYAGAGVSYRYQTAFRSVDPRPSVRQFSLAVQPEITWKNSRHWLGIQPMIGYGYENTSVQYKNAQYQHNYDSYPERRTWLMMGMGYMQPRSGQGEQMNIRIRKNGLTLFHQYHYAGWDFNTQAGWDREKAVFSPPSESSLKETQWGTYTLNCYQLHMLAQQGLRHSIQLHAVLRNGEDFNSYAVPPLVQALNASNYRYRYRQVAAEYSRLSARENGWVPGWGGSLQWQQEEKQDFITAHQLSYSRLTPVLFGELHRDRHGDRFHTRLAAGVQLPLSTSVHVLPTQMTAFSREVVYRDYYYYGATAVSLDWQATYITRRVLHTLPAGITLRVKYTQAPGNIQPSEPLATAPGNSYLWSSLAFNLYL